MVVSMGLRNVTITVEENVARWARIKAARENTSVSHLVGEMLAERMREDEGYEAAMQQYLSAPRAPLKTKGRGYPSREEVHDRPGLR
jgi:hypothetical protein